MLERFSEFFVQTDNSSVYIKSPITQALPMLAWLLKEVLLLLKMLIAILKASIANVKQTSGDLAFFHTSSCSLIVALFPL